MQGKHSTAAQLGSWGLGCEHLPHGQGDGSAVRTCAAAPARTDARAMFPPAAGGGRRGDGGRREVGGGALLHDGVAAALLGVEHHAQAVLGVALQAHHPRQGFTPLPRRRHSRRQQHVRHVRVAAGGRGDSCGGGLVCLVAPLVREAPLLLLRGGGGQRGVLRREGLQGITRLSFKYYKG